MDVHGWLSSISGVGLCCFQPIHFAILRTKGTSRTHSTVAISSDAAEDSATCGVVRLCQAMGAPVSVTTCRSLIGIRPSCCRGRLRRHRGCPARRNRHAPSAVQIRCCGKR